MGANGNELKLKGKKFGKLTVLRREEKLNRSKNDKCIYWICVCDCNPEKEILVKGSDLKNGKKDNCGCMTREKQRQAKRKYNTYNLTGEYGIGYTLKGEEFYFDLEDYDKIKDYCWNIHDGYIEARGKNNKTIKMHRLIMDCNEYSVKVDHIFHKTNDNRKSQLRICDNQENCMNHKIHKNNTSGKSGISYRKDTNKWRVRLWFNGKCYNLGNFTDYDEAVRVRNEKEIELFKEFRCEDENIKELN